MSTCLCAWVQQPWQVAGQPVNLVASVCAVQERLRCIELYEGASEAIDLIGRQSYSGAVQVLSVEGMINIMQSCALISGMYH